MQVPNLPKKIMKNLIYLLFLLLAAVSSCKKDSTAANIIYQDDLVNDKQTWPVDSSSYYVRNFDQGHYSVRVDTPDRLVFSAAPYGNINFPYTVQVDGISLLDDINLRGNVAIVFNHVDHINFDVAEVWTNGTYRIWTRVNNVTSTFVNYTYSSAINTGSGSKNTIKIIQNQSTVELQINNVSMGTFNIALPSALVQTGPGVATAISYYTPMAGIFNNFSIGKN